MYLLHCYNNILFNRLRYSSCSGIASFRTHHGRHRNKCAAKKWWKKKIDTDEIAYTRGTYNNVCNILADDFGLWRRRNDNNNNVRSLRYGIQYNVYGMHTAIMRWQVHVFNTTLLLLYIYIVILCARRHFYRGISTYTLLYYYYAFRYDVNDYKADE